MTQTVGERLADNVYAKQKVLADVNGCKTAWHDKFIQTIEQRMKAYRGVLERRSEAAKWTSKLHPAYLLPVIETIVSNLVEDNLRFEVVPRARPDSTLQERDSLLRGARAIQALLDYDNDLDYLSEKQRPLALMASIIGVAVGKVSWDYRTATITTQAQEMEAVQDEIGNVVGHIPVWKPSEQTRVLRDGVHFEVVDMRDFFWDESADDIQKARWVAHRVWMNFDQLIELERLGVFREVDKVPNPTDSEQMKVTLSSYEDELLRRNRTKGLIEVVEYWTNDRVIVVADRNVMLRNAPNPFEHGMKPFVEFATMPQPFQMGGLSDVELGQHLQDARWLMLNQRVDNVNLLNNSIVLIRSDTDDPDEFEFGPGERWLVDDVQQVQTLQMNDSPATISMETEQGLSADLMDITGGMPMAGQTTNDALSGSTATGASIMQTVAQRRLMAKKQNIMYAWRRVGQMKLQLLQQFTTEARLVPILGRGGASDFIEVLPSELQGDFDCVVKPISESLMRQERRSEAQSLFQVALQAAPVLAATGSPLNMTEFVNHWLDAFDITDPERFLGSGAPTPSAPEQGGGPNAQGTAPTPDNAIQPITPQQGVTNPQLAAGNMSPSSAVSMAPLAAMQRSLASTGAGRTA